MSSTTRAQFLVLVLEEAGLPAAGPGLDALVAMAAGENTQAEWNALATTLHMGAAGESDFNSAGVQNYPDRATGVTATVRTLLNGLYGNVVALLQQNTDAEAIARAWADSPWGTFQGEPDAAVTMVRTVVADRKLYYNITVAGQDPAPPEPAPAPEPVEVNVNVPQLREGATGPSVKSVQSLLNDKHGAGLVTDGIFGPHTDAAVRAAQEALGIGVDGIVGPVTWDALLNR